MMKLNSTIIRIVVSAIMIASAMATAFPALAQAASPSVQTPGANRLTPSELQEVLGPIALYPDPLLANVLAASVYPDEVAEAAKFAATKPNPEQIKAKPWEDPVKAVTEFPDVIKLMGDFPDWTIALGQAYLTQAKDVMDVVQTLRTKAQSNGSLVTTPQQTVITEQKIIYIQPADPQIIYVPTYSPTVVYAVPRNDAVVAGVIGFGVGIAAGLVIANNIDCHWHGGCVGWGWGYHGGGYWGGGHNDIDINRNVNINGDVNIGNRGDVNVSGGDRTNIKGGDRNASRNRIGNEGNAWAPDRSKNLATSKPSESSKLKSGAGNRMNMPDSGSRAGGGRTSQQPVASGARPAQQPAGGSRAGQPAARPSQQPAGGSRVPQSRPPSAVPSQRPSNPSAFEGGKSTKSNSSRGAASKQSPGYQKSGASRSGGGGSRGGGGVGGRR